MLREAAHIDSDTIGDVKPTNALGRENVHHARGEAAVRHDAQPLGTCLGVELLLLHHDLGVPSEIRKVAPGFDGQFRHRPVEVVRDRAEDRVVVLHHFEDGRVVGNVEGDRDQAGVIGLGEEPGHPLRLEVCDGDPANFGVTEQVEGTGAALQAGAENEHLHGYKSLGYGSFTSQGRKITAFLSVLHPR